MVVYLQDLTPFLLCHRSVNEGLFHGERVVLEREHVVGKDDDFVIPSLVVTNQELAGAELVRVHHRKQHLFGRLAVQVFPVKLGAHGTPDFGALDAGDESELLQFQPIGLVQFRPNQKVEIGNFVCK